MELVMFNNLDNDYDYGMMKDEVAEYMECDTDDVTEEMVWDYIQSFEDIDWEDTMISLRKAFGNSELLAYGNVGRWDGTVSGWENGTFDELFNHLSRDCDYFKIWLDEECAVNVECAHHDGRNSFKFKVLSDKGSEYIDENIGYENSDDVFLALMKDEDNFIKLSEKDFGY